MAHQAHEAFESAAKNRTVATAATEWMAEPIKADSDDLFF
ncbi:MAG: hypothetical protein RL329_3967 [Bacteroidota bacterium]|jgi:hypothetical protein